jgi:hypothetical protein
MGQIKVSELIPKDAPLSDTDLIMIAEETSDGYESKKITGHEVLATARTGMQPTLVSGENIKTLNETSLLGSGDISVQPTLVSGTNIKTINSTSLLGSGNITVNTGVSLIAKKTMVTHTGGGNILIASEDISSHIVPNSMIQVTAMYRKTFRTENYLPRLYVNTSATLTGATLIATFGTIGGLNLINDNIANFAIDGSGNLYAPSPTNGLNSRYLNTLAGSVITIPSPCFLIWAGQLTNPADTAVMLNSNVIKYA